MKISRGLFATAELLVLNTVISNTFKLRSSRFDIYNFRAEIRGTGSRSEVVYSIGY